TDRALSPQPPHSPDRDECSDSPNPCSHSCHNAPGRFSCSCPAGFALARDDRNCRDVDECVEQSDECRYNQICENTPGGHRCSCPRGYRLQGPGRPCLDINECLQLPRTCAFQCQNVQGGYRCLCPPGQILLRDGKTCTPPEQSEQNGTTVSHRGPLVPWLRPRTPRPRGSYHAWVSLRPGSGGPSSLGRAWCPAGFIRQNGVCTDLDECQVRSLCQHACRNTEGSYQCLCPAGYRLLPSGKNCQGERWPSQVQAGQDGASWEGLAPSSRFSTISREGGAGRGAQSTPGAHSQPRSHTLSRNYEVAQAGSESSRG
ncbi:hemicentin-2-like, partial [Ailuropoda melanoleuca]|uniref:hemicentin-2-like n=1 Tax=Ailuropoda melanoleuca TaxID=9646 RepID=UPI001494D895